MVVIRFKVKSWDLLRETEEDQNKTDNVRIM